MVNVDRVFFDQMDFRAVVRACQIISDAEYPSTNFQIPNNIQNPMTKGSKLLCCVWLFEFRSLEFIWNLRFVYWNL